MVSSDTIHNSTQWILYHCDSISCDLSNWFAELSFGIIIGLGILGWQILSQRQRSQIFYQQIFYVAFTDFIESANIILKIQDRQEKEKPNKIIPSAALTKQEFDEVQPYLQRLNNNTIKLQKIFDTSAISLSKDMQNKIHDLISYMQFIDNRNTLNVLSIFNFKELLRISMIVCNTQNMLKNEIKRRRKNLVSNLKIYSEKKESKIEDEQMVRVEMCNDELTMIEKILKLTYNLKKID